MQEQDHIEQSRGDALMAHSLVVVAAARWKN